MERNKKQLLLSAYILACVTLPFSAAWAADQGMTKDMSYTPIVIDTSLSPGAGQPRCARLANNDGFKAYEIATLAPSVTLADYKKMHISPPQAYPMGLRSAPQLLELHADLVWGRKFRNAQQAVDALYAACMKSDVARESDQLANRR